MTQLDTQDRPPGQQADDLVDQFCYELARAIRRIMGLDAPSSDEEDSNETL